MPAVTRLGGALLIGVAVGVATGLEYRWSYAPITFWAAAALALEVWAWLAVGRMNPVETKEHATLEDPSRALSDVLLLGANVASLAAVLYVIIEAGDSAGATRVWLGALALLSLAISWGLVQTVYMLRYARIYYGEPPGGIDFNSAELPSYADFAYLAFTMGMAYQVSDTNVQTRAFRITILKHGLISYLFGSVILAATINLVVGLSSG
jgi:uncharacterized membrane protein